MREYRDGRRSPEVKRGDGRRPDRRSSDDRRASEDRRQGRNGGRQRERAFSREEGRPRDSQREEYTRRKESDRTSYIEGHHSVREALESGFPIVQVLLESGNGAEELHKIELLAEKRGIPCYRSSRQEMEDLSSTGKTQGALAKLGAFQYASLTDVLRSLEGKKNATLVFLDGITDPHNLGSIMRSALQAGAAAVVITKNRSVGATAVVAKTSAGALFHLPLVQVTNLVRAMEEAKERGFWMTGTAMDGENLYQADLRGRVGIVIGSEGSGISRLVREHCDRMVRIPMEGPLDSLNASVACGILVFEVLRQRG